MEKFLMSICPICTWVICAFHLVFMFVNGKKYKETKNPLYILVLLVAFGLFYDALILSLGTVLPEGALLKGLSQVRYISHGALIPLLLPICAYSLKCKKTGKTIFWAITIVLIVVGIASGFATVTVPEKVALLRYAAPSDINPAWANFVSTVVLAFGMIIPLLISGIIVWVKQKTPLLFLSGFFMYAFSAAGAACLSMMFFISMFGEVLMVLFMYLYANKAEKSK